MMAPLSALFVVQLLVLAPSKSSLQRESPEKAPICPKDNRTIHYKDNKSSRGSDQHYLEMDLVIVLSRCKEEARKNTKQIAVKIFRELLNLHILRRAAVIFQHGEEEHVTNESSRELSSDVQKVFLTLQRSEGTPVDDEEFGCLFRPFSVINEFVARDRALGQLGNLRRKLLVILIQECSRSGFLCDIKSAKRARAGRNADRFVHLITVESAILPKTPMDPGTFRMQPLRNCPDESRECLDPIAFRTLSVAYHKKVSKWAEEQQKCIRNFTFCKSAENKCKKCLWHRSLKRKPVCEEKVTAKSQIPIEKMACQQHWIACPDENCSTK